MYKDITGIILSGGKSTRMGRNKSLLEINGKTAVQRIADLMQPVFTKVIVISNTPGEYSLLGLPVHKDIYEYRGPLAGIHSGLKHSETDQNFVISVDMPLMTAEMIEYIIDYKTPHPVTVCKADGFIQQLAGRYSKSLLNKAELILQENEEEMRSDKQIKRRCSVLRLLDETGAEIIEAEKLDFYREGIFFNMNRPEDYRFILSRLNYK